jgi:hypothetical protein
VQPKARAGFLFFGGALFMAQEYRLISEVARELACSTSNVRLLADSGKIPVIRTTAVYVACFGSYKRYLNAGEKAVILVLARDRDQAKIVFSYVAGLLRAIPPLYDMIDVELRNHARFAFSNRQNLCGCYDDSMDMLTLQTLVASLENIASWS